MADDPVMTIKAEGGSVVMILKDPDTRELRATVIWTPEQASMIGLALIEVAEKALGTANAEPGAQELPPDGQK